MRKKLSEEQGEPQQKVELRTDTCYKIAVHCNQNKYSYERRHQTVYFLQRQKHSKFLKLLRHTSQEWTFSIA